jgi:hypothetical protein
VSETRNTKITYLYRDGSNYKIDASVIFAGAITLGDRDRLLQGMLPAHDEDVWGTIIPGQVGLADLQNRFGRKEIAMLEALLAPQDGPIRAPIDPDERARYEALLEETRAHKPQWREEDDHIFHEVTDIHLTEEAPTDPRTILEFIDEVERVSWDESWRPSVYEEMVANYEETLSREQGDEPDVA